MGILSGETTRKFHFCSRAVLLIRGSNQDNLGIITFSYLFNDILHMSFLAGTHVFKAFPAYTTTEL